MTTDFKRWRYFVSHSTQELWGWDCIDQQGYGFEWASRDIAGTSLCIADDFRNDPDWHEIDDPEDLIWAYGL